MKLKSEILYYYLIKTNLFRKKVMAQKVPFLRKGKPKAKTFKKGYDPKDREL